jgi:hypothetical protein
MVDTAQGRARNYRRAGMSTSRHHADWLSLVEVSGPFVSLPVLLKAFPQGLDARDPAQAKELRAAYQEWQDKPDAPGRQRAWITHVLTALLGYPEDLIAEGQTLPPGLEANIAEMGETLRPDFALVAPKHTETAGQAHLLIAIYPPGQALDRPVAGRHWKANPATRMMELLHATGVALGLLTNGEHWMLVFAPRGETTGYASWYSALWLDEPITLRAFHSLVGIRRFFGVASDGTLLGLLTESAQDQQEVTDQLGYQVREAVEVLVQAFDSLDQDANRTLLKGLAETALYEAALTVMMRLVFLFSAEERGLLHLGKPLFDDNYAVSTLMEQLQEAADLYGPQVLERRNDAWARLLATFRAVHGGVQHQDLMMPAYGGSLFDPDRYPFLEGRVAGTKWATTQADPLRVNNRVVLHLLSSLQRLRIKVPGGGPAESRRVSFSALGVEQIGHVYEGLLDHTAVRATEPVLGIKGTRDKEAEIPLATLEAKSEQGQDELIEFLHDETGRSVSAIKRALNEGSLTEEHRFLIASGHDPDLLRRIRPFLDLIREDSFERPVVVLPGSLYVTAGTTRRSTGTHYTPPSLTGPIVQHTLEPLVYLGPAEGLRREQWQLKSPKEILGLKVCDMAMGSGAFLVQACRYLAERLTESWENEEKKHPGEFLVTPDGDFSQGLPSERLVPQDAAERLAIARRFVADRCLYGVDINPMAVEMAKLSLWLITLDSKRPFTFLDHAFKCGDSLLGLSRFKQLEDFSLRPEGVKQVAFSTLNLWRHVDQAQRRRELLEAMPSDTSEQIITKATLYAEAEEAVFKLKAAADILVATELQCLKGKRYEDTLEEVADRMMFHWVEGAEQLRRYADEQLGTRRTLHWPLAFPEIMEQGGFDAFFGNPPFMGGLRLSEVLGDDFNTYLMLTFGAASKKADLCAYFFQRAAQLGNLTFAAGLLATNTISQGVTRRSSLEILLAQGCSIYRCVKSFQWPGQASVIASLIHFSKRQWNGTRFCDEKPCLNVNALLDADDSALGQPIKLLANIGKCFQGVTMWGDEFFIDEVQAKQFLDLSALNSIVVKAAMGGRELNSSPSISPSRWAINFGEMNREDAEKHGQVFEYVEKHLRAKRSSLDRTKYERVVVYWWKYFHSRLDLSDGIRKGGLNRVLARCRVSDRHMLAFTDADIIFTDALVVFLFDSFAHFALLQSSLHDSWVRVYASTLKNDVRYGVSDCFETFPFPNSVSQLGAIGEKYYDFRSEIMIQRNEGMTHTYNRFHDQAEMSTDISELRRLHVDMDQAVLAAYGWKNIDMCHGFYETKQGLRYTICEAVRREILDSLLTLNHQRHVEEESQPTPVFGERSAKRRPKNSKRSSDSTPALFDQG